MWDENYKHECCKDDVDSGYVYMAHKSTNIAPSSPSDLLNTCMHLKHVLPARISVQYPSKMHQQIQSCHSPVCGAPWSCAAAHSKHWTHVYIYIQNPFARNRVAADSWRKSCRCVPDQKWILNFCMCVCVCGAAVVLLLVGQCKARVRTFAH